MKDREAYTAVILPMPLQLTKNLSVGVNLGIILGTVTQSETQESAIVEYESSKRAFYADFGVHYEFNTTGRQKWAAGLVFAPSFKSATTII